MAKNEEPKCDPSYSSEVSGASSQPTVSIQNSALSDERRSGAGDSPTEDSGRFWRELNLNERITVFLACVSLLVAIGSLVVAYFTYRVSSDTSDLKDAVGKLSTLAKNTGDEANALNKQFGEVKRQADAAQAQIHILSQQFDQMKLQTHAFQQSAMAAQGQLTEMRLMRGAVVTVGRVAFARGSEFGEKAWTITVILQNSGSMSTENLAVYAASTPVKGITLIQIGPETYSHMRRYTPDPASLIKQRGRQPFRASLGPHVMMPVAHVSMRESDLKRSVTDGIFQAVYGIATYSDNADPHRTHITKFCFLFGLGEAGNISVNGRNVSVGNIEPSMGLCPYWNCTDNECKADKRRYEAAAAEEKRRKASAH